MPGILNDHIDQADDVAVELCEGFGRSPKLLMDQNNLKGKLRDRPPIPSYTKET